MNKQITEQIKKIKGVKKVEAMNDRVVVTFEPEKVAVQCNNSEQIDFMQKHFINGVFIRSLPFGVIGVSCCFNQYLTDFNLTDEWEKYLIGEADKRGYISGVKIKDMVDSRYRTINDRSIKNPKYGIDDKNGFNLGTCTVYINGQWAEIIKDEPIELVEGEIYITRFKGDKPSIFRHGFSVLDCSTKSFFALEDISGITCIGRSNTRTSPATHKQKKKLIRAEVKNGYFHELRSKNS